MAVHKASQFKIELSAENCSGKWGFTKIDISCTSQFLLSGVILKAYTISDITEVNHKRNPTLSKLPKITSGINANK